MKKQSFDREQRIALTLIVRRHLIRYKDEIRMAHAAREEQLALEAGQDVYAHAEARKLRPGVKASTAIAQLIGLPAYPNSNKDKPEHAKYLLDFLASAGPAHVDLIADYFRRIVTSPRYRAEAPPYIQMAIYDVFDAPDAAGVGASIPADYADKIARAQYSPTAVLSSLEETSPQATPRLELFVGTWNVVRPDDTGKRVARLALEVELAAPGRGVFKLYERSYGLTVSRSTDVHVSRGALILLRGGQDVMFIGQDDTSMDRGKRFGYPRIIVCPARISQNGPFIGLALRRHEDSGMTSIKAQFTRSQTESVQDLLAANKIGVFEASKDVAKMEKDIPGLKALLAELETTRR